MENEGYTVQPLIIPASAVNAPHQRNRIWFIAYSGRTHGERGLHEREDAETNSEGFAARFKQAICSDELWANTDSKITKCSRSGDTWTRGQRFANDNCDDPDTFGEGLEGSERRESFQEGRKVAHGSTSELYRNPEWDKNWNEVVTELCRVDDGFSQELYKLEHSNRADRLKALGNAVVPWIPYIMFEEIKKIEGIYAKKSTE